MHSFMMLFLVNARREHVFFIPPWFSNLLKLYKKNRWNGDKLSP